MGRWVGNRFGNTIESDSDVSALKGNFNLSDQYYIKQAGGWVVPPGESQMNPTTHADAIAASGRGNGDYWYTFSNNVVLQVPTIINGLGGKNWIKLHAIGNASTAFWETAFNTAIYSRQCNTATDADNWMTHQGTSGFASNARWFSTRPTTGDYECWNKWDMGQYSFRYAYGRFAWAGYDSNVGTPESGHVDPDVYDNYKDNDNDHSHIGYNSEGSGNKSWHRMGIIGQMQMAGTEIIPNTSWNQNAAHPKWLGDKSGNYPGNTSRGNGSGQNAWWDTGEHATNRVWSFSTSMESGGGQSERNCWCPYEIYIA